jgi:uncharacterized glyoxalase superfamily protein PhnB
LTREIIQMDRRCTDHAFRNHASPEGGVVPYLMLDGADAAIDFYKRALGARRWAIGEDGGRPHHECPRGHQRRLGDADGPMPEYGQAAVAPQAFNLHLQVDDADRWFERAVAAGCTVEMPLADQFWGDRYGSVKDPYGVSWGFGTPSPDPSALSFSGNRSATRGPEHLSSGCWVLGPSPRMTSPVSADPISASARKNDLQTKESHMMHL